MVHDVFDPNTIGQWINDIKGTVGLVREGLRFLPKGPEREKAEEKIIQAEEALNRSEANLAKGLGYHLCKCTFPPQIMLWDEKQKAHICPRPECGHRYGAEQDGDASGEPSGPHAWMR
jgi:hypothetical protein